MHSWLDDRPSRANDLVHVVIVREDLPAGVAAAMIVHAAGESGPAEPHTIAVVLGVPNQAHLSATAIDLEMSAPLGCRISLVDIRESDPPYLGQLMALALRPRTRRDLPRCLRKLPLYSGPKIKENV